MNTPITDKIFAMGFERPRAEYERLSSNSIPCMYCDLSIHRATKHRTCLTCTSFLTEQFGNEWYFQPFHTELLADHKKTFNIVADELNEELDSDLVNKELQAPAIHQKRAAKKTKKCVRRPPAKSPNNTVFAAIRDIIILEAALKERDEDGTPTIIAELNIDRKQWERFANTASGQLLLAGSIGETKMRRLLELRGFRSRDIHVVNTTQPASTGLRREIQDHCKGFDPTKWAGAMWIPSSPTTLEGYIAEVRAEIEGGQVYTMPDLLSITLGKTLFLTKTKKPAFAAPAFSM